MMQCAMGAVYTVIHVYCTYFYLQSFWSKYFIWRSNVYALCLTMRCLVTKGMLNQRLDQGNEVGSGGNGDINPFVGNP